MIDESGAVGAGNVPDSSDKKLPDAADTPPAAAATSKTAEAPPICPNGSPVPDSAQRPARTAAVDGPWLVRWGIWSIGALGAVVGAVVLAEFVYYRFTKSMTNDAFVEAHIVHLAP